MNEQNIFGKISIGLFRIIFGWLWLWAFFDKAFGLGFNTASASAWFKDLANNSPTYGYLNFGVSDDNFLKDFFVSIAGNPVVDWLFMLGLLGIGLTIVFGVGVRIGSISGAILSFLMYLSAFPLEFNPFVDEHLLYVLIFIVFAFYPQVGRYLGLGKYWEKLFGEKKLLKEIFI